MCCGTHVSNTSHLQAIKLLGAEKGKKGKTNLSFVAAGRVLNYLNNCLDNEKALTGLLKGGPESHVDLVDKLQKNFKNNSKMLTNVSREMATKEVERVTSEPPKSALLSYHTKGDNECMNIIISGLETVPIAIFLTNGDEKKEGNFVLSFPEKGFIQEECGEIAKKVMHLLEAKGFGKNRRWQGKVMKMSGRDEAESLIAQWASKHLQSAAEPSKQAISKNSKTSEGCSIGIASNVAKTPVETSVDYPPLTLYTYPENPRAYKGLICACYSGISVRLVDQPPSFILGQTDKSADFLAKFPSGKVPALEIQGEETHLNESNAIAEYLSTHHLIGQTKHQRGRSNQWIQFSTNQLIPPLSVWVYHVLGIVIASEENLNKAKEDAEKHLRILDDYLLLHTYLVQERVSTCDVIVFCDLLLAFQHVFNDCFLNNLVNLRRWFKTIANQNQVISVIGNVKCLSQF